MTDSDLLSIGALATASGLTASALRFYDDSGLLPPARVDPGSGYRYYTDGQRSQAVLIRRLREIDMPLHLVAEALDADRVALARIVDEHVHGLVRRAGEAVRAAESIKDDLSDVPDGAEVALPGLALAGAVEQVLAATATDRDVPALAGVLVEVGPDGVVLAATDRYRLSTRTLAPRKAPGAAWSVTADAGELRALVGWIRGQRQVRFATTPHAVRFTGDHGRVRRCRSLPGEFPDYRQVLAALRPVRTRALVGRDLLLEALEAGTHPGVRVDVGAGSVAVSTTDPPYTRRLPAVVTGPDLRLAFDPATLHPAVATAVGPDVMVDMSTSDQPVVVRSAARGDLTTLAMPFADPARHHREEIP